MTNIARGNLTLILSCMYISYKLVAVLQVICIVAYVCHVILLHIYNMPEKTKFICPNSGKYNLGVKDILLGSVASIKSCIKLTAKSLSTQL